MQPMGHITHQSNNVQVIQVADLPLTHTPNHNDLSMTPEVRQNDMWYQFY